MFRRGTGQTDSKKRRPLVPNPPRLLGHLKRWEAAGARHVVEYGDGRVASVKHAWATAVEAVGIEHCTHHDLRRTAVTWAMQSGINKWHARGFFGLTMDVLESTYEHHHPDYLRCAVVTIGRKRVMKPPSGQKQATSGVPMRYETGPKSGINAEHCLRDCFPEAGAAGSNPATPTTPGHIPQRGTPGAAPSRQCDHALRG